jgi:hypothetical protein
MLYLKVMSDQDLPDSDPSHDFVLIQLGDKDQLSFERRKAAACSSADGPVVYAVIDSEDSPRREIWLAGTAYVLNAQGKTIASRSPL